MNLATSICGAFRDFEMFAGPALLYLGKKEKKSHPTVVRNVKLVRQLNFYAREHGRYILPIRSVTPCGSDQEKKVTHCTTPAALPGLSRRTAAELLRAALVQVASGYPSLEPETRNFVAT